uniref:Uncharacterized protein LOC103421152 n=1 Tax=Rhizophora mucronata TaxID=61149 RepID=A0A2P2PN50_RHIMU
MQRMGTPVKSSKPAIKPETCQKQQQASKKGEMKAKKRIIKDSDDGDKLISSPKRRKA